VIQLDFEFNPFAVLLQPLLPLCQPAAFLRQFAGGVQVSPADRVDDVDLGTGQRHRVHTVVEERVPRQRTPLGDNFFADSPGVFPDFPLRVIVHSQRKKMKQVVEVHLPVRFRVRRKGKILASLFARHSGFQTGLVDLPGQVLEFGFLLAERLALVVSCKARAALPVTYGLQTPAVGRRRLRRVDGDRVTRRILVHIGRTVAYPLTPAVHRHAHVKFDLAHLEGRAVTMAHQVADQAPVFADLLRTFAVGYTGRLDDGFVRPHIVDDTDESVVEHLERRSEYAVERGDDGANQVFGLVFVRGGLFRSFVHRPNNLRESPRRNKREFEPAATSRNPLAMNDVFRYKYRVFN